MHAGFINRPVLDTLKRIDKEHRLGLKWTKCPAEQSKIASKFRREELLPFLSYRERQTVFRVVTRLKHSSLSRQTVVLRFRAVTCQILRQFEAELSKFDMLVLQNATVSLNKLECFKRVTTREKVCHSRKRENGSMPRDSRKHSPLHCNIYYYTLHELSNSFQIDQKRTVNFRNQRP